LAAASIGVRAKTSWLPTESLSENPAEKLSMFDGLWCVPASPYRSMEGALGAIRFARENRVPFLGSCGGFQHALIEYARNVRGLRDADHAETNPQAGLPLISRLSCSLVEKDGQILLEQGSRIMAIYGEERISEQYRCNFGLNPECERLFQNAKLRFTGRD